MISEFPLIHELSTLSPIPNFRIWLLDRMKQGNFNNYSLQSEEINVLCFYINYYLPDVNCVFTNDECKLVQNVLKEDNIVASLKKIFNNSLWTSDENLCNVLKEPLLRACAWYLYKEKRRNYALNNVGASIK